MQTAACQSFVTAFVQARVRMRARACHCCVLRVAWLHHSQSEASDRSAAYPLTRPLLTEVEAAGPAFIPFPALSPLASPSRMLAPLLALDCIPSTPLPLAAVQRAVPEYVDRPQGTLAEQCVAADLSFIDPLHAHRSPVIAVRAVAQMWWIRSSDSESGSGSGSSGGRAPAKALVVRQTDYSATTAGVTLELHSGRSIH